MCSGAASAVELGSTGLGRGAALGKRPSLGGVPSLSVQRQQVICVKCDYFNDNEHMIGRTNKGGRAKAPPITPPSGQGHVRSVQMWYIIILCVLSRSPLSTAKLKQHHAHETDRCVVGVCVCVCVCVCV